jgi:hypothetical protein
MTVMLPKLKRGTPEFQAHMQRLGAMGGRATRDKHPGHLQEIAASGGRATRQKPKKKTPPRAPGPAVLEQYEAGLIDVDAFLASLQIVPPHA